MTIKLSRWFAVPPEMFELGRHVEISRGAILLFVFLCWKSDKRSSRRLVFGEDELSKSADISKRRLGDARKQLLERGLVTSERQRGGKYVYELCDIEKGRPYAGDPKTKAPYKKKTSQTVVDPVFDPAAQMPEVTPSGCQHVVHDADTNDACTAGLNFCDESFPFGWNVITWSEVGATCF
jgi:DNA-binding transcriptional ArsR family regulator